CARDVSTDYSGSYPWFDVW
nr:immunoglobulin heavy chain junction region [Macaca mulatta]MOW45903.1 immunoglobulin heavy chain junction region [Macaca mulatta]MOW46236.1 immunoglobulin heavy chain junction region [Macaca mulatta]MOW46282.1 immunoglobulin heavy chain junction region [Macaca mulatta]MOW46293.1 immunoglobulin heavy chain junction region [Macaca mulatta]